jgi:hypothetical protein
MINAPSVRSTGLEFLARMKLAQLHVDRDGAVSVPSFRPLRKHAVLEYHIGDDVMSTAVTWTRKMPV